LPPRQAPPAADVRRPLGPDAASNGLRGVPGGLGVATYQPAAPVRPRWPPTPRGAAVGEKTGQPKETLSGLRGVPGDPDSDPGRGSTYAADV